MVIHFVAFFILCFAFLVFSFALSASLFAILEALLRASTAVAFALVANFATGDTLLLGIEPLGSVSAVRALASATVKFSIKSCSIIAAASASISPFS